MASEGPNLRLAAAMDEARMSRKGLARRVVQLSASRGRVLHTSHQAVTRWLSGGGIETSTAQLVAEVLSGALERRVTPADIGFLKAATGSTVSDVLGDSAGTLDLLGQVLLLDTEGLTTSAADIGDGALAQAALSWLVDRDPRQLPQAQSGASRVGMRDVLAIRTAADMFMRLDFLYGGGHGRRALRHYVRHEVLPLLDGCYTEEVGRALFGAAGEVTQLLGWSAYDTGDHTVARHYFLGTLQLARRVDDRLMGSRILASLSHQANYIGRYDIARQMARAGLDGVRGAASPRVSAMFLAHEARALANLQDEAGAVRAMRAAESHLSRAVGHEDPPWLEYFNEAELLGEFAHCFRDLNKPALTIEYATAAVEKTDPAYARTLTFCRMVLAAGHHQARDLEAGLATARVALEDVTTLQSARVVRYVEDFQRTLSTQHQHLPAVADFNTTVSTALSDLNEA